MTFSKDRLLSNELFLGLLDAVKDLNEQQMLLLRKHIEKFAKKTTEILTDEESQFLSQLFKQ